MGAVSQALGLSGEQHEFYKPGEEGRPQYSPAAGQQIMSGMAANSNNPYIQKLLQQYGAGGLNLNQLQQSMQTGAAGAPDNQFWQEAMTNRLATDPLTASRLAQEQVMGSEMYKPLFGQGGTMGRTLQEEQRLAGQGYQLTPEDQEAYGQASGNVARLFGQQEQGVAQDLASRGLAGAGSGAAIQAYSGLGGNKNEMLAQAQKGIADARMQNTMQRLNQTRNFLSSLNQQQTGAVQDQFGRNLAGMQARQGQLGGSAEQERAGLGLQGQLYGQQEGLNQASLANKQSQKGMTLGESFGSGLKSGVAQWGQSIGSGGRSDVQRLQGGNPQQPGTETQTAPSTGWMSQASANNSRYGGTDGNQGMYARSPESGGGKPASNMIMSSLFG